MLIYFAGKPTKDDSAPAPGTSTSTVKPLTPTVHRPNRPVVRVDPVAGVVRYRHSSSRDDYEKCYLKVTGMTCASCVNTIEKNLIKVKGNSTLIDLHYLARGYLVRKQIMFALRPTYSQKHISMLLTKSSNMFENYSLT